MASSRARSTKRGTRPRTARAARASCENPTRSKPPDGAAAPISMDKVGRETMPTTTEALMSSRPVRENVRRGRSRDHERRRVRSAEHGEMSLPRRAGPRRVRREDPRGNESRDLPRAHVSVFRRRGAAPRDADTLAIADKAAASGRRPGAAAVRPAQQSRQHRWRCLVWYRSGGAPVICGNRPARTRGRRQARVQLARRALRAATAPRRGVRRPRQGSARCGRSRCARVDRRGDRGARPRRA
jgi:hypothetical protein